MGDNYQPDPLDIPPSLKRDANNRAEYFSMAEAIEATKPPKKAKAVTEPKANGHVKPVKAASAPKAAKAAKVAAKPEKAPKAAPKASKAAAKLDQYGFREGSNKSKAIAMYARKGGATLDEVKDRIGSIQLNCLTKLEADGYTVEKEKEKHDGKRAVTRYFLKAK
jgi:hypothetical protein